MYKKILIANRGEIAARITRSCHELGISVVAVYSDADADALHARLADQAVHIGPAAPAESYLNINKLIEVAQNTDCEAIHPGYGFLSESPDFAHAVTESGIDFIGPPTEAIRKMGVKTEARALMQAAGIPIVPGFQSTIATVEDFKREADRIGYPVMVKASGGGGGKGIRIVENAVDLADALGAARREAQHAFNDPTIFLERYIARGRHIEVQILADSYGNVVHLFERDCSIQRRHQKIIEEAPSTFINEEIRQQLGQTAVKAVHAVNYVNAGTVEFIVDQNMNFYFLEMNTRLQVEHPITELITGIDIVNMQIQIAAGQPLPFSQQDIIHRGHAIECRIYAEDPASNFLPCTGPVLRTVEPAGPGIRVDAGVVTGDTVTIHYDPMIAKLIVLAQSRPDAIRKMDWALAQYVILGLTTNVHFLRDVIQHPVFVVGDANTHFINDHMHDWYPPTSEPSDDALIAAAIAESLHTDTQAPSDTNNDRFSPWSRSDGFRIGE